ncbi:signal peptidase II [Ornithinimicrobium pekingense]|uniref:Lipoprotein signal peptidase n=1 Tax=Ornithinimicrobium pekingense TaxID=384677 RepID=A0ABQ2FB79_9MICO|nr:signal peptidase II [Ornithinimicrobium pekingense]GGK68790.1 lipoprotein signal peptidase [Ornithinimicrobium pekingense]
MQAEAGTPLSRRPRRTLLVLGIAAVWIVLDQVTKLWAERALTLGEPVQVVGDLLRLHLIYNSGAAFSLGTGSTGVLTVVASIISVLIVWQALKVRSLPWAIALGLLLGGAVGNLVDRFFRAPAPGLGHVVDFLRLPNFPIFNVADIGVTTAACLIALLALRGFHPDGTREGKSDEAYESPRTQADDDDTTHDAAAPHTSADRTEPGR